MAAKQRAAFGVEVIVDELSSKNNPYCEHGPTLLFERFYGQGKSRKFFACSACRDRKQCPFFQLEDEKSTNGKVFLQKEVKAKLAEEQASQQNSLTEKDTWCFDCNTGFQDAEMKLHKEHAFSSLTEENMKNPSLLFLPKENNKSNAQFLFDEDSGKFLVETIKKMKYEKVICVGTPRLFEIMQQNEVDSMLLDIDGRYGQFFSPEVFMRFNMFNNYFFNTSSGNQTLREFVCDGEVERVLLVVDPPFGGLINVLASTFKQIWNLGPSEQLDTMLVFPYFLESHVLQSLPTFKMLDYKVGYSNHTQYNNKGKNARGSPVRIFTNIELNKFELPKDKYRFCKSCKKYVYKENQHCKLCKECPSKDGRTYIHCKQCRKCVKPGRNHCTKCELCLPVNHKCSENLKLQSVCHICGSNEHKRRDCTNRKRSGVLTESSEESNAKKRKIKSKKTKTPKKKIRI